MRRYAAGRLIALLCSASAALLSLQAAHAGSLRFFGNGVNDIDRVKIRIDDPSNSNPGPPADIGNGAFTIEFWIKGSAADNNNSVRCGSGVYGWIDGDIVIDRDRFNLPRSWGLSLGNGRVAFGVNVTNANITTVCGSISVLNNAWHHVAVTRATNGTIAIFIDGTLDVSAAGPAGDLSYPDDGQPQGNNCGGQPCINSDPFLVLGAEKHDAVPGQLAFNGFLDELRLSTTVRYSGNFTPASAPFSVDAATAALYHFDEATSGNCATGTAITDAAANASPGVCRFGGSPGGPVWSTDTPFSGSGAGTLQLSTGAVTVSEGVGNATLTVTRTGGATGAVGVSYASADGTATAGGDYTAVNAQASFATGETTKTITVPILDDANVESAETFTVTLSAPTNGATLGSPASATVTITDNDSPGSVQLSAATYAVTEGTPTLVVTVARTNGVAGAATVNYATSDGTANQGIDYISATGTLTWNSGEGGNKTFPVTILDDALIESAETFNVSISSASGAALGTPNSAVVTIADNDSAGSLQLSAANYAAAEATGTQTITVSRSGGTIGAVSVNYATSNGTATAPADYGAANGTLSWANAEGGAKTFAVAIVDDTAVEGSESFTVTLSGASGGAVIGAPGSATVTITDNDVAQAGTLQLTQAAFNVSEAAGTLTLMVSRTNGTDGAAQVRVTSADGTATAGSDYVLLNQTLQWSSGEGGMKSATLSITNDSVDEPAETLTINLQNVMGATLGSPASATVTLDDDDAPSGGGGGSGNSGGGGSLDPALLLFGLLLALGKLDARHIRRRQGILRPRM